MNLKVKIILFSLLCISLISISTISAQDINDEITISEDDNYDELGETYYIRATNFMDLQAYINIDNCTEIVLREDVTKLDEEQKYFWEG